MKVLISADMEGTCGVVSWTQVMPPEVVGTREPSSQDRYLRTRQRMTAEVNAAVEGALAAGVKVTGCTVHVATLEVDAGPILAQEVVPVRSDDTVATLHERIKEVERRLYPATIKEVLAR